MFIVVDFVDDEKERFVDSAQAFRQFLVHRDDAILPVDDKEEQIARGERDFDLGMHLFREAGIHIAADAARINDFERGFPEPAFRGDAVAGTPGMSCTMEIFRPASRLKSADLPTFGRPTMATVLRACFPWAVSLASPCPPPEVA